jgi:hypothetical protein
MKDDYLKYWRVVRYFIKAKYKISEPDLEMLLFLKSERYFTSRNFKEYLELFPWDRKRFNRLLEEEWIVEFPKKKRNRQMYELSFKAKRMLNSVYKKLNGEEFPEAQNNNPLFATNVPYTNKVYRNMIKEINKTTRQQRYHAQ